MRNGRRSLSYKHDQYFLHRQMFDNSSNCFPLHGNGRHNASRCTTSLRIPLHGDEQSTERASHKFTRCGINPFYFSVARSCTRPDIAARVCCFVYQPCCVLCNICPCVCVCLYSPLFLYVCVDVYNVREFGIHCLN